LSCPAAVEPLVDFTISFPGRKLGAFRLGTALVQRLGKEKLRKVPYFRKTLDWSQALMALEDTYPEETLFDKTLPVLLKYRSNIKRITRGNNLGYLLKSGTGGATNSENLTLQSPVF